MFETLSVIVIWEAAFQNWRETGKVEDNLTERFDFVLGLEYTTADIAKQENEDQSYVKALILFSSAKRYIGEESFECLTDKALRESANV